MTLRDAMPMAAARWNPYAMLLAQGHNINRIKDQQPISPDELNPFTTHKPKQDFSAEVWLPWDAVAARLAKCGFKR